MVDHLETDMSYDLIRGRRAGEERKADLPARGILAQLIEKGEGLGLDVLVALRVEGDLNGALDLFTE